MKDEEQRFDPDASTESQTSEEEETERSSLSDRGTAVGASNAKKIAMVVGSFLLSGFLMYFFVFNETEEDKQKKAPQKTQKKEVLEKILESSAPTTKDVTEDEKVMIPEQLPDLSELVLPETPKPPPAPMNDDNDEFINPFSFSKGDKAQEKDRRGTPDPFRKGSASQSKEDAERAQQEEEDDEREEELSEEKGNALPPPPGGTSTGTTSNQKLGAPGMQGEIGPGAPEKLLLGNKKLDQKTQESRMKSSMIAYGGGSSSSEEDEGSTAPVSPGMSLKKTSAKQITNSYYGDKRYMVLQGKMIEIVLETAINTDLKGLLRGLVSRDVYAESGKNILIPKGSRVIGTYSSSLKDGQSRIAVVWTRILRPDGIDINLSAPATDRLGRSGVSGEVDYHFADVLRNSILVSLITIVSGVIVSEIFDDDVVSQTVNQDTGSVTSTSSGAYGETTSAISDITDKLESYLTRTEPTRQTITVHSGAVVKAFIREDIVFVGDTAFVYSRD